MAASVKLVLRKSKQRADGTAPVWLRITANRKSRYVASGVYLPPKDWNDRRQEVRKSHPLSNALNSRLTELRLEAEHAALGTKTADAVKTEITGGGGSLTSFFEQFIEALDDQNKYWEHKKYKVTLGKLQDTHGTRIDWDDLSRSFLTRFESHCREKCGNNPNTTRKELSRLRRVLRQAIKEGTLDPAKDPFLTYDMPKGVSPDRRRLRREEVEALCVVEVAGAVELARDAFLFSFYGGGVRFGDICRLRPEHIDGRRLRYRMMKTEHMVEIPLPEAALAIAERWQQEDGPFLFPLLQEGDDRDPIHIRKRISVWNVIVNKNLKKAARRAKITKPDEVTFHVARHSFADFARRNSGDLYAVSKALGHANLRITEQYLSEFDRDAVDQLADNLWNDE